MEHEYKTLVLVDHSDSVSVGNRDIIDATLKYLVGNNPGDHIAIATFDENINYLTDYDATKDEQLKAIDEISYLDVNKHITDVLMRVINEWTEEDFAMRNIVLISDGLKDLSTEYPIEELYLSLAKTDYPVYVIGCVQEDNKNVMKDLAALSRISGGKMLYTEFENSDAGVEEKICEALFAAIEEKRKTLDNEEENTDVTEYTEDDGIAEHMMESIRKEEEAEPEAAAEDEYDVSGYTYENEYILADSAQHSGTVQQIMYDDGFSSLAYSLRNNPLMLAAVVLASFILVSFLFVFLCVRNGKKKSQAEGEFLSDLKDCCKGSVSNGIKPRMMVKEDASYGATAILGGDYSTDEISSSEDNSTRLLYEREAVGEVSLEDLNDPTKYYKVECVGRIVVGRAKNMSDITLDYDDSVSGRHCEIGYRGMDWYIRDLNSSNGTYVNGQKVFREHSLSSGDLLRLGHAEFRISYSGGGDI